MVPLSDVVGHTSRATNNAFMGELLPFFFKFISNLFVFLSL